jgi:hypothetical protein
MGREQLGDLGTNRRVILTLFICGLFNYNVSSSCNIPSNDGKACKRNWPWPN